MTQPGQALVEVRNVWKRFGRTVVLRDVSLSVPAGEVLCLIGPSGSGKSTLLRCINHLEKIEAGRITVDGRLVGYREANGQLHELRERDLRAQRADVGMVFQHFNLFPHLTALENVVLGPVRVRKRPRRIAESMGRDLLRRVGLSEKAHSYPAQLSGGQQQRVAIARALAMEPKLLLFDEPTSALDPEVVGDVLAVMRSLAQDGITMIVVTHEISFARDVAHRVAFMDRGSIVEEGPPDQVLSRPVTARAGEFLKMVRKD
jgi:polar amino acid transport system ATP-binding protein